MPVPRVPEDDVVVGTEVAALDGVGGQLEAVTLRGRGSGALTRHPARHLFSFIGAEPNTEWLRACGMALDSHGFVLTGTDAGDGRLPLETSHPGVFAVGDVRSASVKRVAAAVGDGAQVVAALHRHLASKAELVAGPHADAAAHLGS